MKYLYWVWFVVFATALFQAAYPILLVLNGGETLGFPDTFFGTLVVLALLTILIVSLWILIPIARLVQKWEGGLDEDLRLIYWTRLDTLGRARIAVSILLLPFYLFGVVFWFVSGLVGWVYRAYLKERNINLYRPD